MPATAARLLSGLILGLALFDPPALLAAPAAKSVARIADRALEPLLDATFLLTDLAWSPRFDDMVQRFPDDGPLGAAWNPGSPQWREARQPLDRRLGQIERAFRRSGVLEEELRQQLAKLDAKELGEIDAALSGKAGAAILRQQVQMVFLVAAIGLEEPPMQTSDPRFPIRINELGHFFGERMPPLPEPTPDETARAAAFTSSPLRGKLGRALTSASGRARVAIDGRVNLVLFDDHEAIVRELAAAVEKATERR